MELNIEQYRSTMKAADFNRHPATDSLYLFLIVSISFILSAIGRTLIPRYFRSIFDGGVTELYYTLKNQKESFHNTTITLDCDQCTMVTQYGKPMYTKVRITTEFIVFAVQNYISDYKYLCI